MNSEIVSNAYRRGWLAALAIFVLAGSTGALMRFGLVYGFPAGLQFVNVRHAHSHLMYFGWVTPALMALIAAQLPAVTDRPLSPRFRGPIILSLCFALLAYAPFLLFGYRPAPVGGRSLPLSVMGAGLNIVGWYWFAWRYRQATRGCARNYPLQLWDTAVIFMLFATLGGWGLPLLTLLRVEDPFWSLAFTHVFLDSFAFGWFILAVLGLAYATHPALAQARRASQAITLTTVGLPLVWLLGMPQHVVPTPLLWLGGLAGALVALGLLLHAALLWRVVGWGWRVPLFFLLLTAVTLLASSAPAVNRWAAASGLRVPYLHWLLLGFVTLGLVRAARERWGAPAVYAPGWMVAAVLALLLTLLPLTALWPLTWGGLWTRQLAAWAALLPVLAAVALLLLAFVHGRRHPQRTAVGLAETS